MLSGVEIALIVIIIATFALIVSNRLPVELVAMLSLLVLGLSEIITPTQALSGFSNPVVMVLIGLFVIIRGLEDTGVIRWLGDRLYRIGGSSEIRLITLFMLAGALLSLVMNNVAAGAVLLPAAVRVSHISKVSTSKLLIPLSFGTLAGGMATYLTTANIIMSGLLQARDLRGLGMSDFIPTGALIVVAGLAFMLLIGRHLLPDRPSMSQSIMDPDLHETYQLDERMWEVVVGPDSRLANCELRASGIGHDLGLTVLAVWHGRQAIFSPGPEQRIYPGDYLLVLGREERVKTLLEWGTSLRPNGHSHRYDYSVNLAEVIVPPRSPALGRTLTELAFRNETGLTAVALWREGRSYRTDVGKMPLQVGDAVLVVGQVARIQKLASDPRFIVPRSGVLTRPPREHKAPWAVVITAIVLLLAIFDFIALPLVMLAGAVAMVLSRCLTMEDFYRAVEWRVIFLVAGMLPLSLAITTTGLGERTGRLVVDALTDASPLVLIAGLFLVTTLVVQIIGGQVTALFVGPIAINVALQFGVSPQAMGVAIAIACSTAFITPVAHPVNVLMMGPGGYRFSDFVRIGLGMTGVTLVSLLAGMVLFWGIG